MTITTLKHTASGATCTIDSFGATVVSFQDGKTGQEQLFVSPQAVRDGSQAIRGGIPIVFPVFGPSAAPSTMPQHGFARVNEWTLLGDTDDEEEAATAVYTLKLANATAGRGTNNHWCPQQAAVDGTDCTLRYEIRLEAQQLTCTLIVENTGTDVFNFQALLHTYLRVPDVSKTAVHGLGGYAITDKVSGDSGHVQSYDEDVTIQGEVDCVFIHPEDHPTLHAIVQTTGQTTSPAAPKLRIEAAGMVDETPVAVSAVVWNPGPTKAAAMSDLGDTEYQHMLCVEPGLIGHVPLLAPGKQARLTQSIIVE
jgi:glucose-6-phosphate 1-epimerase